MTKYPLVVGIDPDLVKSGVAVVKDGVLTDLKNLNFSELRGFIKAHPQAVFVLEDVEINKPVFDRKVNAQANLRIAQNVGMVKGVARLIAEYLTEQDCLFTMMRPLTGHAKHAKKNADYFRLLTGWEGRSNEDNRDAAMLAIHGVLQGKLIIRPSEVPH